MSNFISIPLPGRSSGDFSLDITSTCEYHHRSSFEGHALKPPGVHHLPVLGQSKKKINNGYKLLLFIKAKKPRDKNKLVAMEPSAKNKLQNKCGSCI